MKIHSWPFGIICFFIAIIGFNTYFATLAASGYQGILDEHPYVKGLAYDTELRELKNFAHSGWRVFLEANPASMSIRNSAGAPLSGAKVVLHALRPDESRLDQELPSIEKEPGMYVTTGELKQGTWIVNLLINKDGESYRARKTISIGRPGEAVRLDDLRSKNHE